MTIELYTQTEHMKFSNKLMMCLLFLAKISLGQSSQVSSNLKDFEGVWLFIPPEWSNDTSFFSLKIIKKMNILRVTYWKESQEIYSRERYIGFAPQNKEIQKLSDLVEVGTRLYFFSPNPKAPNDSIKYFEEASPSCLAMYNGIAGEEEFSPPEKGKPNYFTFNFNGRENEYHQQIHHLPNPIVQALCRNSTEKIKVEAFLKIRYAMIKTIKTFLYKEPSVPSKMYLIKNDPIEIIEEKNGWLKIRYYPEKNGEWIG
ncbi:hypothetical protein, partial [Cellulophaga sp. BC115SP]|uniref:hypothetical protein n=1 Tax=Cellulophaga sp. BC115SP TaxID=2683263 RepID=UPI00196AD647